MKMFYQSLDLIWLCAYFQ